MRAFATLLRLVLRFGLGGLFVVAGAMKARDPAAFATEITNFQLVPAWAPVLAIVLPPLEILAGAALLVGPRAWRQAGALVIAALLLLFTAAVAWVVWKGIDTSCGCFGKAGGPVTGFSVVERLGLLAAALAAVRLESPRR